MSSSIEPSLLSTLKSKMRWHEARQGVLAENVANAATPGYRAHDLKAFDISAANAGPNLTDAKHMSLDGASGPGRPGTVDGFERTPDANTVVLEEQMMKASQNQMDHQMAAMLYQKSLGLLRAALGKG